MCLLCLRWPADAKAAKFPVNSRTAKPELPRSFSRRSSGFDKFDGSRYFLDVEWLPAWTFAFRSCGCNPVLCALGTVTLTGLRPVKVHLAGFVMLRWGRGQHPAKPSSPRPEVFDIRRRSGCGEGSGTGWRFDRELRRSAEHGRRI